MGPIRLSHAVSKCHTAFLKRRSRSQLGLFLDFVETLPMNCDLSRGALKTFLVVILSKVVAREKSSSETQRQSDGDGRNCTTKVSRTGEEVPVFARS